LKAGKRIFLWHHWCGLIVGVFLLIMSTTGAILTFSDEIESAYDAKSLNVQNPAGAYSYDASLSAVRKQYPDWEIRLYGAPGTNEAIVYDLRKGGEMKKVFAHPITGQLLYTDENVHKQLHRQMLMLHYTLFAGTAGKVTVFFIGLLFLGTLITGVFIYRKAIGKVLTFKVHINRNTDRSFYSSLHRIIGVWSLLFNMLIVVTGLFISGNIALTALKKVEPKKKMDQPLLVGSIDAIKSTVLKQYPDFTVHLIRVAAKTDVVQLSGSFKEDPFYYGNYYSRFYVQGNNMIIQKKEWLKEQPALKKWQSISGPLHFGNYGGLPVKILYAVFGLMPGILSITGFFIWQKRKRR
jgi:uncharacterized iron-regulated membrane protein